LWEGSQSGSLPGRPPPWRTGGQKDRPATGSTQKRKMIKFLKGVRVLEYAVLFNGDQTGCLLADLGADVIKMEAPTVGDWMEIAPAQTSRWARRTARRTWRTIAICTPAGARVRRDTDPGVVGGQRSEQKLRVGPVAVFRPGHACRMACTGTSASADQRGEFEGARTDRPSPIGEIPPDGEEPLGPGVDPRSQPHAGMEIRPDGDRALLNESLIDPRALDADRHSGGAQDLRPADARTLEQQRDLIAPVETTSCRLAVSSRRVGGRAVAHARPPPSSRPSAQSATWLPRHACTAFSSDSPSSPPPR
jgi:hypothetical protein